MAILKRYNNWRNRKNRQVQQEIWRRREWNIEDISRKLHMQKADACTPLELVENVYGYIYWEGIKRERAIPSCSIGIEKSFCQAYEKDGFHRKDIQWFHSVSFSYQNLKIRFRYQITTQCAFQVIDWEQTLCFRFQVYLVEGNFSEPLLVENQKANSPFQFLSDVPENLKKEVLWLRNVLADRIEEARAEVEEKEKLRLAQIEAEEREIEAELRKEEELAKNKRKRMLQKYS